MGPFEGLVVAVVEVRDADIRGGVEKLGCLGICWAGGGGWATGAVGFRDMDTMAGSMNSEAAGAEAETELTIVVE